MPKHRSDLDPSIAFTGLLEYMPGFADSPDDDGATTRRFLEAWYLHPGTDMWAFARIWGPAEADRIAKENP
ncbi:MAG: hypothetical protein QOG43_132 [Actinomycetota bacterium]|jgi:hypothetical protein|nr:hypothetical protein [Actinomycetota bacterium]